MPPKRRIAPHLELEARTERIFFRTSWRGRRLVIDPDFVQPLAVGLVCLPMAPLVLYSTVMDLLATTALHRGHLVTDYALGLVRHCVFFCFFFFFLAKEILLPRTTD